MSVLSNCAWQMETALVLSASTQAGALEETVKRFAPANPASCVLTKLDEAASLGGALTGPNPTERDKQGSKDHIATDLKRFKNFVERSRSRGLG